ncbi:MAG: hypothetical protein A4E19_13485 [Nitrospira sp. SG-bin1]|nr:MAG: hypothetical protein A4E19_13485 [Nitrospira sp. SG-bin1]
MSYRYLLGGILFSSLLACTSHTGSVSDSKFQIVVDPSTPKEILAPWLFYAGSRAHWMEKKFFEQNPGVTSYQYTFMEEVEARKRCAHLWREVRVKDGLTNRYLDDLVTVLDANFLEEYTWTYFRSDDWRQPNDLRLAEFDRWRSMNLQGHKPETRAVSQFIERQ